MHLVSTKHHTQSRTSTFLKTTKTYRLLHPKNRIIQLWLTLCSDPSIVTFTSLFTLRFNWEQENDSFDGTWNHGEELYKTAGNKLFDFDLVLSCYSPRHLDRTHLQTAIVKVSSLLYEPTTQKRLSWILIAKW
jgi:hypothetical protein